MRAGWRWQQVVVRQSEAVENEGSVSFFVHRPWDPRREQISAGEQTEIAIGGSDGQEPIAKIFPVDSSSRPESAKFRATGADPVIFLRDRARRFRVGELSISGAGFRNAAKDRRTVNGDVSGTRASAIVVTNTLRVLRTPRLEALACRANSFAVPFSMTPCVRVVACSYAPCSARPYGSVTSHHAPCAARVRRSAPH